MLSSNQAFLTAIIMIKILVEIFGFFMQFVKIYIVGGGANKNGGFVGHKLLVTNKTLKIITSVLLYNIRCIIQYPAINAIIAESG